MYNWKPHDINNPFKTRKGERIVDLNKYIKVLNENNIPFTKEQYENAIKEIKN